MVEFALAVPVLFFVLFGVLDGSMGLYAIGSARYAAGEAGRLASELGTDPTADTAAVGAVRTGPLGQNGLVSVTEIDVFHVIQQSNGTLIPDPNVAANRYRRDGTVIGSVGWPPSGRNVRNGSSDFLGLTISYQYRWASGRLLNAGPLPLTQSFYVRLEPQAY
jgi:Flp pilus assembly protein TadG